MKAIAQRMRPFCISLGAILGIIVSFWLYFPAQGRDLSQWGDIATDAQVRKWYETLMRPDHPQAPCCGEADAYEADSYEVEGDHYVAIITDTRPDEPRKRPHIEPGTRVPVPNDKLKWDQQNPTGHGIIFMSTSGYVFCFAPPGGV